MIEIVTIVVSVGMIYLTCSAIVRIFKGAFHSPGPHVHPGGPVDDRPPDRQDEEGPAS
ncbi:MAG: hypothetical protein ACYS5V_07945 [Planctomycetota bacterium]|jgi:hypothetical protein